MMTRIANIKQHRVSRQARQVNVLNRALSEVAERRANILTALESFTQHQQTETERLFCEMACQPIRLPQVDEYNRQVAKLKARKDELMFELNQVKEAEVAAQKKLQDSTSKLRIAERTMEKFQLVADDLNQELNQKILFLEENHAEEMSADTFQSCRDYSAFPNQVMGC